MAGAALRGLAVWLIWVSALWASPDAVARLERVMHLDEIVTVLRDEGLVYGASVEADMLGGDGGSYFRDTVSRIYDAGTMQQAVRLALSKMPEADLNAALAFFDTAEGARILTLETSARVAMADPTIEESARAAYLALVGRDDARLAAIGRFVEANDLIERNVAGALASNYHFFRGLVNGGGMKMDEDQILSQVWEQEDDIRAETEEWLFGYLLMAYGPLEDATLEAYIAYSETPSGQALNAALFDGFDTMYRDISRELGLAVSLAMQSSRL